MRPPPSTTSPGASRTAAAPSASAAWCPSTSAVSSSLTVIPAGQLIPHSHFCWPNMKYARLNCIQTANDLKSCEVFAANCDAVVASQLLILSNPLPSSSDPNNRYASLLLQATTRIAAPPPTWTPTSSPSCWWRPPCSCKRPRGRKRAESLALRPSCALAPAQKLFGLRCESSSPAAPPPCTY